MQTARAGHGSFVLVSGEAGIGKTALVRDALRQADESGMRAAAGSGYDLSTTPPFGPWAEILQAVLEPGQDLPLDTSGHPSAAPSASLESLFRRTRDLLNQVATPAGLLVVLDDAHWADQASLDLLRFLGRTLQRAPVALVVSYRTDELPRHHPLYALIPTLVREAQVTRLDLKPLNERPLREWVAEAYRLPQADEERLVGYLLSNAEGNPFFATEILRTVEEDGLLVPDGHAWRLADLPAVTVPSLLQQVIDVRVNRLTPEGRQLLTTAAVIGYEVPLDLWEAVTGEPEDALIDALDEAAGIWLVAADPQGRRFTFRHALIREILYQSISPPRRRLVHQRVAELLAADRGVDPDVVAHHFQQADDERAVEWLVRAAERAWRTWAWTEAADRYQRATDMLASIPERASERAWLLLRLAEARRYNAPRRALEHVHQAERTASETDDGVLLTAVRWVRGRIVVATDENGLPDLEAAVAGMRDLDAEGKRRFQEQTGFRVEFAPPIFAVWLAMLGRYSEALDASRGYFAEVAASERLPLIDAEAHLALGIAHGALGKPDESVRAFQAALDIYLRHEDNLSIGHTAFLFLIETVLPYMPDDLARRAYLAEIGDAAWKRATEINITRAPIVSPPLLLLEGDWNELRAITGRTVGLRNYVRIWTAPYGAAVARNRGDLELANAFVQAGLPPAPGFDQGSVWMSCTIQSLRLAADLALDTGNLPSAERWIGLHEDLMTASGRVTGRAEGALLRARLGLARDRKSEARACASQALACASTPRQPLALLQAHRMLGDILLMSGELDAAAAHISAARELSRSCAAIYESALTATAAGRLALARADTAGALRLFDEAAQIATALNAPPLLEQIEYERERSGPAAEYPDALTVREVEVLRLVVEGWTDAQIADALSISPRTVMTHVSNVLGKTGAPSRAAAAAYAVRRGLA